MRSIPRALRRSQDLLRRFRRLRLVTLARLAAFTQGASLHIDVAPDVRLGRDVRVVLADRCTVRLVIGAGARIDGDVILELRDGAEVEIGPHTQVRRGCRLVAAASLTLEGNTVLSWNCYVFSAYGVAIGQRNAISQNVSIVDSRHFFTAVPDRVWQNVEGGPVSIGRDVWIGPNALIGAGTTVGEHCVIAANAVVTKDIAPHRLAVGMPAREQPLGNLDRSGCANVNGSISSA